MTTIPFDNTKNTYVTLYLHQFLIHTHSLVVKENSVLNNLKLLYIRLRITLIIMKIA